MGGRGNLTSNPAPVEVQYSPDADLCPESIVLMARLPPSPWSGCFQVSSESHLNQREEVGVLDGMVGPYVP
jgi:hypothetical protein